MSTWTNQTKNSATWSNQSASGISNPESLLMEPGDNILMEDSSLILLESSGAVTAWSYQTKN